MTTVGTVRVEFAGTRAEARALADANLGLTVPNRTSPNGLPFLSVRYTSAATRVAAHDRFVALGWDREFHEAKATHQAHSRRAA